MGNPESISEFYKDFSCNVDPKGARDEPIEFFTIRSNFTSDMLFKCEMVHETNLSLKSFK